MESNEAMRSSQQALCLGETKDGCELGRALNIGVSSNTPILTSKEKNIPLTISGIDTLYYFCESNEAYDDFFLEILDQLEEAKGRFEKKDISYENSDLKISINNQLFEYNGKAQGFYWFMQANNFVSLGFKDTMSNRELNDIQIQLNAIGIYTLGLKSLLRYVDDMLHDVITGYKPVTRCDLNIFVQDNLSWITKEMFVTRKRVYASIFKEIANKHRLQTLYIGKKPFLLRLYDKQEELKASKKQELMYEYFANNNFDIKKDIFNIEFELHRSYLRTCGISTVDNLLLRAKKLFSYCMKNIRLVDLDTFTDNTNNQKNKNRASTHPLWEHFEASYTLDGFLTLDIPLERVKRKNRAYTIQEAIKEHLSLAKKFYIHGGVIDEQFYDEILQKFQNSLKPKDKEAHFDIYAEANTPNIDERLNVNILAMNVLELEKYLVELENDILDDEYDTPLLVKRHNIATAQLKSLGADVEIPI
jgi:hypothetical protein